MEEDCIEESINQTQDMLSSSEDDPMPRALGPVNSRIQSDSERDETEFQMDMLGVEERILSRVRNSRLFRQS